MEAPGCHDAVRRSYDAVAGKYAAAFRDELGHKPLDRALLASIAEQAGGGAPIADLGCGPGHVTAWLARRGASAVGIDLAAAMVEAGRRDCPQAEFRQGDLLELPAGGGEFAAVVALYSIIHLAPDELPRAFGEIHRVLRPPGLVLAAFHAGSGVVHRDEWMGEQVDVDFRFLEPAEIAGLMEGAGLRVEARLERVSYPQEIDTRRAYLLGRRQA